MGITKAVLLSALLVVTGHATAMGAESSAPQTQQAAPASKPSENIAERNFYEILDDILADFEYDLKNGQVTGLKDISIRNIATSETIPPSFKSHLELVITEKILKNTKSRIIQCLPCKAKRTTLNGDQVTITSPDTNPVELARIAKMSNIMHFLDVAFAYQPSGMVLSMFITEPDSGGIIWSRSYNSETSRAAAFRRGVDYAQVDDARRMTEYQPSIQYRATLYYLFEREVGTYTGCLGFGFRMMERYNNRRQEVGFEANYLKDATSLISSSASTTAMYGGINMTMLFVHGWNFIGEEENFNTARGNFSLGVGGTYASGFLGGLARGMYEWRLAKHWAVTGVLGYRPSATRFISGTAAGSVSGVEFGFGISGLF